MNILQQVKDKSIKQAKDLKGKKVVLRLDLNVSLGNNGNIDKGEDWRIIQSYKTLDYLQEQGACVIVLSHIGRAPQETLKPVLEYLQDKYSIGFIPRYDNELISTSIANMQQGAIMMLENVRQHEGEKKNNPQYLDAVIQAADFYVNDAFSVSHREHASVHAITKVLPSYFGLQFVDEIENLSKARAFDASNQEQYTYVFGGAKFGTKLTLLEQILPHVSYALIGGALANVFLKARGFEVGNSYVDDVDVSKMKDNQKIILPVDCVDQHGDVISIDEVQKEDQILDIGPETEKLFQTIIGASDVVVWNGPMGKYEDGYTSGSDELSKSIAHSNSYSVTGGGDTAAVIVETGNEKSFDFISTGGGAMLDFLLDGTLVSLEALITNSN